LRNKLTQLIKWKENVKYKEPETEDGKRDIVTSSSTRVQAYTRRNMTVYRSGLLQRNKSHVSSLNSRLDAAVTYAMGISRHTETTTVHCYISYRVQLPVVGQEVISLKTQQTRQREKEYVNRNKGLMKEMKGKDRNLKCRKNARKRERKQE
jgi:hypothetical protein